MSCWFGYDGDGEGWLDTGGYTGGTFKTLARTGISSARRHGTIKHFLLQSLENIIFLKRF